MSAGIPLPDCLLEGGTGFTAVSADRQVVLRFLPVGAREESNPGQVTIGESPGSRQEMRGLPLHAAEVLNLAALAQVDRDGARTALQTKIAFHGVIKPCPVWIWTQDQVQAIWDAWPKEERTRYIASRRKAIGQTPDRHVAASAAVEEVLGLEVNDLVRMRIGLQILYALYRPKMSRRGAEWEAFLNGYLSIGITKPVAERLASVEVAW